MTRRRINIQKMKERWYALQKRYDNAREKEKAWKKKKETYYKRMNALAQKIKKIENGRMG